MQLQLFLEGTIFQFSFLPEKQTLRQSMYRLVASLTCIETLINRESNIYLALRNLSLIMVFYSYGTEIMILCLITLLNLTLSRDMSNDVLISYK